MSRGDQVERAIGGDYWLHTADNDREAGARLDHIELGGHFDRALELFGPSSERVSEL